MRGQSPLPEKRVSQLHQSCLTHQAGLMYMAVCVHSNILPTSPRQRSCNCRDIPCGGGS